MSEYCINCKHFDSKQDHCLRTQTIDLVTGKPKYKLATFERNYNFIDSCGQAGKFFDPITDTYPNNWYEGHYDGVFEAPF